MNQQKWIPVCAALFALAMSGCASAKKQPTAEAQAAPAEKTAAPAAAAAPADAMKVSCSKGEDTRVLEVVKKDSGCSLDYTKHGQMSPVSTSAHGNKHCLDSQKKIRAKLETAGYKCS